MSEQNGGAKNAHGLRAVLFDLDGTLVDSVRDLSAAADAMMGELGLGAPGEVQVRNYVGNGIERLVHRCLTADMHADAPPAQFEHALSLYMHLYTQLNGTHSTVYAGVREGIELAAERGLRLGCVTNKAHAFAVPLLETLKLLSYFDIVIGGDTTAYKKPHPAPLQHALQHWQLQPEQALFVGDSIHDVAAARAAQMRVICVNYGYNHDMNIADANPDAVISSLTELQALL